MITLSIVSHGQASLVASLLDDISRVDSSHVTSIIVTHNVPETPPPWPPSLAARIRTVVNRSPRGFGANHNAAFAICDTPYFTVMNPDLHLAADPFAILIDRIAAGPRTPTAPNGVGMAAPLIVTVDGRPEDSARSLMTPMAVLKRRLDRSNRKPALLPDWLAGMFLMISSTAYREVGGFDERYFMYCEDFDLCARLRLAGWGFEVVDETTVMHAAQRASHRSRRHLYWHVSSLLKMWASSTFWRYRRLLSIEGR